MIAPLTAAGILLACSGGVIATTPLFWPEMERGDRIVERVFQKRASAAGLRGDFSFHYEKWSRVSKSGGGSYIPADEADSALFNKYGGVFQSDGMERASRMFWTNRKIFLLGAGLLITGAAISLLSAGV